MSIAVFIFCALHGEEEVSGASRGPAREEDGHFRYCDQAGRRMARSKFLFV